MKKKNIIKVTRKKDTKEHIEADEPISSKSGSVSKTTSRKGSGTQSSSRVSINEKENASPSFLEQVKLKKSEPKKISISETRMETVVLKSHKFEQYPQEQILELPTQVTLGESFEAEKKVRPLNFSHTILLVIIFLVYKTG